MKKKEPRFQWFFLLNVMLFLLFCGRKVPVSKQFHPRRESRFLWEILLIELALDGEKRKQSFFACLFSIFFQGLRLTAELIKPLFITGIECLNVFLTIFKFDRLLLKQKLAFKYFSSVYHDSFSFRLYFSKKHYTLLDGVFQARADKRARHQGHNLNGISSVSATFVIVKC